MIKIMNVLTLVFIVLSQIMLVFFFITSLVAFKDTSLYIIGIPIQLILVIALNILSLFILIKIFKQEERRKVNEAESTHVEEFQSLVTSVRSDRHDLNNHLTVISGLIKINSYDAANSYIQKMIGEIRINNKVLTLKNPILASILYSKMDKYHREEVPFHVKIEKENNIEILSSTDLIRLISNLLDNAYEATRELPSNEQEIHLEILDFNETFKIIAKNTAVQKKINEDYFINGYSTKSQDGNRGYGLAIIRKITEKYNGTLEIHTNDHLVCFEISFPKGL
ncbi:GHKL domain-containing protein [Anaerobacillus sp. CMMVII]|uniref:sensor histidine kinase n=1 Tax=Anaerobacillus sp. CMMVII TaxID=2755588 RepID=UPI0021B7AFBD|nr:GHKL domain-containing protein [Anaerobacillus sp. CMMVII]MCT8139395.1 GHKL domain-containing protein [Anaerobacillus sp. CMMVII]